MLATLFDDPAPPVHSALQHQIPIFSLPGNWLWCESWCGQATKEKVGPDNLRVCAACCAFGAVKPDVPWPWACLHADVDKPSLPALTHPEQPTPLPTGQDH